MTARPYYHIVIVILLIGSTGMADMPKPSAPQDKKPTRYVCPPCPVDCHDTVYDQPGRCPQCGMTLVEQDSIRNVAILIWDGVEVLDFSGPAEVFAAARIGEDGAFNVFTVSPMRGQVISQGFLKITPNYTLEDCPTPHVLVIPGGNTRVLTGDEAVVRWVRKTSNQTDMILSVCTGAFVLAKAGLLDRIEATTWHGAIDALRKDAPKTTVHDDRRFVDNGDIITCAGVSAGIDGALHAVTRLCGPDVARRTARYMEYDWRPMIVRDELRAEVRRRVKADPEGVLFDVERALRAGTREATRVLEDADLFALHEHPRFRELIRTHTQRDSASLTTPDEPGKQIVVRGRVTDTEGQPISAALLYVYHTDAQGGYSTKGGNFGSMGDSLNPRLFGYLRTGRDGVYEYRTILPGQYPETGPPAHVHYEVTARGYEKKVTELMFEGDSRIDAEARRIIREEGFIISAPSFGDDGVPVYRCDIKLQKS